jgi:hypothetical protein
MRRYCYSGFALLLGAALAVANEPKNEADPPRIEEPAIDVVLVTGEQPGPALWKVSAGNHDLWILGEVSPLPRKVKWRSKQFESLLANSQEVILHDSSSTTRGRQAAQLTRATELPDERSLKDIMSPELFARIENVAKIYGVSEPLEALSPPVVATRFANASLKALDLRVIPVQVSVESLARKAGVRITNYSTQRSDTEVPFEDRLQTVKDSATAVCPLERVVQILEDGGAGLRNLANAWAVGDIEALRRLVPEFGLFTNGFRADACVAKAYEGQKHSDGYIAKRTAAWLTEAERALRENESTLAVVPIPELFAADGYLAALRARGYEVIEPE